MEKLISVLLYTFSVIYTFVVWGIGWGILSIFLPIFPMIDLVKYLFK